MSAIVLFDEKQVRRKWNTAQWMLSVNSPPKRWNGFGRHKTHTQFFPLWSRTKLANRLRRLKEGQNNL